MNEENLHELYVIAFRLINKFFRGKVDKAGKPYEDHLMAVYSKFQGELKILALLHDILEDTDCTKDYLLELGIPKHIVSSIEILTRHSEETYKEYIDRLVTSNNTSALLVKKADLEHNMDLSRLSRITNKDINRVSKRYLPAYALVVNKLKDLGIEFN